MGKKTLLWVAIGAVALLAAWKFGFLGTRPAGFAPTGTKPTAKANDGGWSADVKNIVEGLGSAFGSVYGAIKAPSGSATNSSNAGADKSKVTV